MMKFPLRRQTLLGILSAAMLAAAPWSALARPPTPAARSILWQRAFEGLQADVPRRAMAQQPRAR